MGGTELVFVTLFWFEVIEPLPSLKPSSADNTRSSVPVILSCLVHMFNCSCCMLPIALVKPATAFEYLPGRRQKDSVS